MTSFTRDLDHPTHSNCAGTMLKNRYVWAFGGQTMIGRVTDINVTADEVTITSLDNTQSIVFSQSNLGFNENNCLELDCFFEWDESSEAVALESTGSYIITESLESPEDDALSRQIGGDHYKDLGIQPIEFIEANEIPFLEACVIKRVSRHEHKTGKGRQDIEKAIHELQLILQFR